MAKKSRSKKETCCHSCLNSAQFKDLNRVEVPMHSSAPERGNQYIFVCDKCVTKYEGNE